MPVERQGRRNDLDDLYSMIKDGYSDYQILEVMPESLIHLDKMERIRQTFRYEQYKEVFRNVSCHYIYGTTGSGKTRSVVEHFGYTNLYRVTDYMHPFDSYKGQDVMVFEEFRSGIPFSEMLSYLDGHPVELPCRYFNKHASYTKVYILTNIPLSQQYTGIQMDKPDDWMAFLRRINTVTQVFPTGSHTQKIEFTPDGFYRMLDCEVSPFD